MSRGIFNSPIARWFNTVAVGLTRVPVLGSWIGHGVVVIRYTGRRSGRTFETPVSVTRDDNEVTINVMAPDSKNWWRNFLGEGGELTLLNLDGGDRTGRAVAHRDGQGKVAVTVQLDAP
ncbi:hypothetical protein [Mycolicibacterium neworleansense]|uniref:Deazaflavin-dependent nitroreductase family protein n=1 Tax=Mycolicibacterium neworleansense TaxID=146018 RepID=A0A0H5RKY1_9MYCO|nr:hypothetical protein [Mycolicibacterium neworleansense]MCV7360867.1 hypothetical protein [Mycolicibacterium neworleansense]CRZ14411.1 hypothetical protein BN2156_01260 [Mycolicibacterium neworleansense]